MKPLTKAILVALLHVAIISSLGAKLLYDRHTRPRAWFKAAQYDPNLPIRGRYLSLQLEVKDPRSRDELAKIYKSEFAAADQGAGSPTARRLFNFGWECGTIDVAGGEAVAVIKSHHSVPCSDIAFVHHWVGQEPALRVGEPVLFFLPDTSQDPTRLKPGEELWVLATIPRQGPPRPISLGIKRTGDAAIQPLKIN